MRCGRRSRLCTRQKYIAELEFRINPNISVATHAHTATGSLSHKFGVPWGEAALMLRRIAELPYLRAVGIAALLGSQITDIDKIYTVTDELLNFADEIQKADSGRVGRRGSVEVFQRVATTTEMAHLTSKISRVAWRIECSKRGYHQLPVEPGRSIVAEGGSDSASHLPQGESDAPFSAGRCRDE